jgi:ankyrin repeat protein
LLVKNNANVNTQNSKGNTPLHYAHAFGHRKIIDLMMENEASEEVINEKKLMPWEGI